MNSRYLIFKSYWDKIENILSFDQKEDADHFVAIARKSQEKAILPTNYYVLDRYAAEQRRIKRLKNGY